MNTSFIIQFTFPTHVAADDVDGEWGDDDDDAGDDDDADA